MAVSAAKILQKYESTHGTWRARLDPLEEERFTRAPPAGSGSWGIGQICDHIASVAEMLLINADQCAQGNGQDKGFQLQPALICLVGSLPPVRINVPDLPPELDHLSNPQKLTKEQALARLDGALERMRSLADAVDRATTRCRSKHPVGGWLHARQWYHMNEMHYRHHLRQLDRLN